MTDQLPSGCDKCSAQGALSDEQEQVYEWLMHCVWQCHECAGPWVCDRCWVARWGSVESANDIAENEDLDRDRGLFDQDDGFDENAQFEEHHAEFTCSRCNTVHLELTDHGEGYICATCAQNSVAGPNGTNAHDAMPSVDEPEAEPDPEAPAAKRRRTD